MCNTGSFSVGSISAGSISAGGKFATKEKMADSTNIKEPVCLEDFEKYARTYLPKKIFDYYACGATDEEQTIKESKDAYKRWDDVISVMRFSWLFIKGRFPF